MLTYYLQNEPLPKIFACQGAEQCRHVMLQSRKIILQDDDDDNVKEDDDDDDDDDLTPTFQDILY